MAERILVELLERRREANRPQRPSIMSTMAYLADTYFRQQRYLEALPLRYEVVYRCTKLFGSVHQDTLHETAKIASIFVQLGQFEDAQSLQEKTLQSMKSTVGKKHPATLFCKKEMATVYAYCGRLSEFKELITFLHGNPHRDPWSPPSRHKI